MEPVLTPEQEQRAACLPWALGAFGIGFFVLLLTVATGGYFIWFVVLIVGVGMVASMHYLLWGRLLDEQVTPEREEETARNKVEEEAQHDAADGYYRRPPGRM